MAKYMFANEAVKYLEEIWSYTKEKWSLAQADTQKIVNFAPAIFITRNP